MLKILILSFLFWIGTYEEPVLAQVLKGSAVQLKAATLPTKGLTGEIRVNATPQVFFYTGSLWRQLAAITDNVATATALASNPSDCASDTYATAIAASGNLTCGTVTNAGLAGSIAASKLVGSDIATVGTITSGTWSGTTIALNKGGTGQTTANAAFNALSPMTTGGDLIYGGASGVATRLANGSNGEFLRSAGGTSAPTWAAVTVSPTAVNAKTANYTLTGTDKTVTFDPVNAALVATLPTAVGASGTRFTVKNIGTGTGTVALATTSSQTVDGRASSDIVLKSFRDFIEVESDGSNWLIINKQETSTLEARGTSHLMNAGETGQWNASIVGNSLTMGIGHWRVTGFAHVFGGTGPAYLQEIGFYGAAGTGTGTPPAAIAEPVVGMVLSLSDAVSSVGVGTPTTAANLSVKSEPMTFDIFCAAACTVYLVPKYAGSFTNTPHLVTYIQAIRVY